MPKKVPPGTPCSACGQRERLPGESKCIECRREYHKKRYKEKGSSNNGNNKPTCPKCNERTKQQGRSYCCECDRLRRAEYWLRTKDDRNKRLKAERADNPDKFREYERNRWHTKRKFQRKNEPEEKKQKQREARSRRVMRLRSQVIEGYGGICACQGCNESRIEFIAIDHTNNDGSVERKQRKGGYDSLLLKLIREGFPPTFQLLCHNCNMAKAFYGYCPHAKDIVMNDKPVKKYI